MCFYKVVCGWGVLDISVVERRKKEEWGKLTEKQKGGRAECVDMYISGRQRSLYTVSVED